MVSGLKLSQGILLKYYVDYRFSKFHMIEERLYSKNLLSSSYNNAYFMKKSLSGTHIEDDHIPFLRKGALNVLTLQSMILMFLQLQVYPYFI